MKYKRFWIDRNKAVNFYGELTLVFLQVSVITIFLVHTHFSHSV